MSATFWNKRRKDRKKRNAEVEPEKKVEHDTGGAKKAKPANNTK